MLDIPVEVLQQQPFIKCRVLNILKMIQQNNCDYLFSLYISIIDLFSYVFLLTHWQSDLYCIFIVLFK